jgi:hypothetical protein
MNILLFKEMKKKITKLNTQERMFDEANSEQKNLSTTEREREREREKKAINNEMKEKNSKKKTKRKVAKEYFFLLHFCVLNRFFSHPFENEFFDRPKEPTRMK